LLVVVDGPEKAGKTTLTRTVVSVAQGMGIPAEYVHWGPIPRFGPDGLPGDTRYLQALERDVLKPGIVIWDRSWASEYAYGTVPGQDDHRLVDDPWRGEWLYGRAAQTGLRLMLLGPDADTLRQKRDETDLPIDPEVERERYRTYGTWFGWDIVENLHTEGSLRSLVDAIIDLYEARRRDVLVPPPPVYCGPYRAEVVILGERRNLSDRDLPDLTIPGAWLPFTSPLSEKYGRVLGPHAFRVGWTHVWDIMELHGATNPLHHAKYIMTCGKVALEYAAATYPKTKIASLPHPSALYLWGQWKDRIPSVELSLNSAINKYAPAFSPSLKIGDLRGDS
jgi:hypothetical protein